MNSTELARGKFNALFAAHDAKDKGTAAQQPKLSKEAFGLLLGVPNKKKVDATSLARLKKELAKPRLTKSAREGLSKKEKQHGTDVN